MVLLEEIVEVRLLCLSWLKHQCSHLISSAKKEEFCPLSSDVEAVGPYPSCPPPVSIQRECVPVTDMMNMVSLPPGLCNNSYKVYFCVFMNVYERASM